ncbi:MAG: hypothetical protein IJO29_09710 [Oscillospiraceae bacterium]|nr:hypothetical protein [Oscillospiraceae bacterium]
MTELIEKIRKKLSGAKMTNMAFVLGLCGIVLIGFSSFSTGSEDEPAAQPQEDEVLMLQDISCEYGREKEKELEALLGSVAGVGNVRVMVNVSCSEEYVYAVFESGSENISPDSTESQYSYEYFTYESQGDCAPLMTKVLSPKISSCVVACEGAASATVREEVYMTVSAALGISVSDIYVAKLS